MEKNCESLCGYMIYVDKVRNYNKFMPHNMNAELTARENKLLIKEKLDERGMSLELADIITCTDENEK